VTHNPEHLRLARFFLDERGNHNGEGKKLYYELEAKRRGEVALPPHLPLGNPLSYYQADRPVVSQTSVEGHSVRCMYLMTGVADLCLIDRESKQKYLPVLQGLWDNMVQKKMYLTGGIGAEAQWEGFSRDYWLPQGLDEGGCYAETCAAIGVVMLAERLLQVCVTALPQTQSQPDNNYYHNTDDNYFNFSIVGTKRTLRRHYGAKSIQRPPYRHVP